jgi:hypothetical protein
MAPWRIDEQSDGQRDPMLGQRSHEPAHVGSPPGGGGHVGRAAHWLRGLARQHFALLLLLLVDAVVAWLAFSSLPVGKGVWAWGDLPGFYVSGGIPSGWVGSLSIYPLAVGLASQALGQTLGENLVYLAVFILPSLGIYAFLSSLSQRKLLCCATAVTFGTVLSPIYVSAFTGGAFEYGLFILFGFLAFRYAWLAGSGSAILNASLSGLFFGLSLTQLGGQSGLEYFGAAVQGLYLLPILAWSFIRQRQAHSPSAIPMVGAFFATVVGATAPIIVNAVMLGHSLVGSPTRTAAVHAFVFSNVAFTYQHTNVASLLFDSPFVLPNLSWQPAAIAFWIALVTAAITLGTLAACWLRNERRWLARAFLAVFVIAVLWGWGVGSGSLLPTFTYIPILQFLDNPFPLLVMLTIPLPVFLILGIEGLDDLAQSAPSPDANLGERSDVLATVRAWAWGLPRHLRIRDTRREVLAAVVVFLVGMLVFVSFAPNLGANASTSPGAAGSPIYSPAGLTEVGSWYASQHPAPKGSFLVFPNTPSMYPKDWAVFPRSQAWAVPYAQDVDNASYNTSRYYSVISLLAQGDADAFALQSGIAGVEYVAVLNLSGPVVLSSSAIGQPELLASNVSSLRSTLEGSGDFVPALQTPAVSLLRNTRYLASPATAGQIISFSGPTTARILNVSANALLDSNFSDPAQVLDWDRYPQANVTPGPNSTAQLIVNGSSPLPYANFAGVINLSLVRAFENASLGRSLSPDISFDPSGVALTLRVSAGVDLPAGTSLQLFVYWYNSSAPGPLFSEFASDYLGEYSATKVLTAANISIPSDALSARLFFYAVGSPGFGAAKVLLSSPSVQASLAASDYSQNATVQVDAAGDLVASAGLPPDSLPLAYPYALAAATPQRLGLPVAAVYPAVGALTITGRSDIVANLSLWDTWIAPGSDFSLLLSGLTVTASTLSANGSSGPACNVPAGLPLLCLFRFGVQAKPPLDVNFTVSGRTSLSLLTIVAWPTVGVGSGTTSLPLPIGFLDIRWSVNQSEISRVASQAWQPLPDWAIEVIGWTPFACLVAILTLVGLQYLGLLTRITNAITRGPRR